MKSTLSINLDNPHINALQAHFDTADEKVEWLVIAHNESSMLSSLATALSGQAAVILEVPQETWNFEDGPLAEAIEWALEEAGVQHIILAGNSQAGTPGRVSAVSPCEGPAPTGYDRLLAGVQHSSVHHQNAQQQFANQTQKLWQSNAIQLRRNDHDVTMFGLFYRCEDGLFLAYDPGSEQFELMAN